MMNKTVKELRVMAKEMKIKNYSRMKKEELVTALCAASEPKASETHTSVTNDNVLPEQPTKEEKTVTTKLFQFRGATNIQVQFYQKGELVTIGWSKRDFKMYIHTEKKGARVTSYGSIIRSLSKFQNGAHGDIALIIHCLKRIARKPAPIILLERKAKENPQQAKSS